MGVNLSKGQNTTLTGLKNAIIGLGWNARSTAGADFDLDVSAFLLGETGKVRGPHDFIFYNQLKSNCGSVEHMGDNRTGDAEGDDEQVKVSFAKVPSDVARIVFGVTIHEADMRQQNFGQVNSAFIRVVDADSNQEIARFDLSEDYSTETSMVFGELYFHQKAEWKFRAIGQGYRGGLAALASVHGVDVG